VRLLCFSDLHCAVPAARRLAERAIAEDVDVMVSAGDLATDETHEPALYEALVAAGKPIFAVRGNHDGDTYRGHLVGGTFCDVDGRVVEHLGVAFAGWGLPYLDPALTGTDRRLQSEEPVLALVLDRLAQKDPRRTVFVSHLPPWGVRVGRDVSGLDMGNAQLRRWIEAFQPALVVCGHVHLPHAKSSRLGTTIIVNGGPEGYVVQIRESG
jgi:Icc-related predicted phosphoesterase